MQTISQPRGQQSATPVPSAATPGRRVLPHSTQTSLILITLVATTIVAAATFLHMPAQGLAVLAISLPLSGTVSLVLGEAALMVARRRRARLGVKLAVGHLLGMVVVLLNVVATAALMFFSEHDLHLLLLLLVYGAAVAVVFAFAQSRSLVKAIGILTKAARQMAAGDLQARVAVPDGDEIGELCEAFNWMVAQLERATVRQRQLEQARRDLISAVSHDLRTPLASIRVMAEALCDQVVTDADTTQRYYQTIRAETERLDALIRDLFELTQIDTGALRLKLEPVSLGDLISDTLRRMAPQASKKRLICESVVPASLPAVRIDAARIQRVLVNLIENAIRHTPDDGRVSVTAVDAGVEVRIDIADTGEGIDEKDVPFIFDRFYQSEQSALRDSSGAGLGLAIARGLVEAHGGQIWVRSVKGDGSVFSFTIPTSKGGLGSSS